MSEAATTEWRRSQAAVFYRTRDLHGQLSNMCGGMPLTVRGIRFGTAEALYQAARFPGLDKVQLEIAAHNSPMGAKMVAKSHRAATREDWDTVKVAIMRWVLATKLIQHSRTFGAALAATGTVPIVEQSRGDRFWGAKARDEEVLVGENVLGRLLTELRDAPQPRPSLTAPPAPLSFLLGGREVAQGDGGPAGPWFAPVP